MARIPARLVLLGLAIVRNVDSQTPAIRIGPGVTPPRITRKVEPHYSPIANAERIQGTVILQIVVTEKGRSAEIRVLSPLGFGLDEKAEEAIEQWEFIPGQKDGKPVPILATVEVTFRLQGLSFDAAYEEKRTTFNLAVQTLQRNHTDPKKEDSVQTMISLAKANFPGALYVVGKWEMDGENNQAKDAVAGSTKIQKAADKNYGPAMYEMAMKTFADPSQNAKSWDKLRSAATLGSQGAQFFLGDRYQRGDGVEQNPDRAKNYFRLCAARGAADCQFRLAELLFNAPNRRDYEYEQALAWYQLAAAKGVKAAEEIVQREQPNLNVGQQKAIETLKRQFIGNFN